MSKKPPYITRKIKSLLGLRNRRTMRLDYEGVPGQPSEKAERLVAYCMGDYYEKPIIPCTNDSEYLRENSLLYIKTTERVVKSFSTAKRSAWDQKKVVRAWIEQKAIIPPGINAWLVRGDGAGHSTEPKQGLHFSGMRNLHRRDLILVPTSCRNRYLGPNLANQLEKLKGSWVPWEDKTDTVWWGGALTGDSWTEQEPRTITRREVICHFRDHPQDHVKIQLTEISDPVDHPEGVPFSAKFTKREAFSHKSIVLLPGNDIASGSSWYFAGNSAVIMPKPHQDHMLYFEIEPWKHYIPLENDPADILVKHQWVLDNQEEAQQIVANSHERLRWLSGPEYLWACNEVLRRIAQS